MGVEIIVPVAFFTMITAIFIGTPMARAWARRVDRQAALAKVPSEVTERLERMEHAIDSIAIEVERISEGQRFTTKLLSERHRDAEALPAPLGNKQ
jgi:Na+/glutamate symporter